MTVAEPRAAARRRPLSWRRRLDIWTMRWQARLDAGWADRVLPWGIAALLTVVYFVLAYARARALAPGPELGPALQAAWLIRHGHSPGLTITGRNFFADQVPLAFYPLAQLTRFVPARNVLLGVQSLSLACAVVPIWRIARSRAGLRVGAAAAIVFVYALSPAVNDLNLAGFHQEALAVPALIGAAFNGMAGRWRRFAVLSAFAVLCRADLAIAIAGLGILLAIEGKRRAGRWTIVIALGWLAVALVVIEPLLGTASLVRPGAFVAYGHTPLAIIGHVFAHPMSVFGDLVAREHLDLAVVLFAPLLFLPLLAPRYLLPALPLELLYLLSSVTVSGVTGARYTVAVIAFSFVAAPFALGRMGRRSIERVLVDRRILGALLLASFAFFARDATDSPYNRPWDWSHGTATARAALEDVDTTAAVRASPRLVASLAERRHIEVLHRNVVPDRHELTSTESVLAIDADDFPTWTVGQQSDFTDQLRIDGWKLDYDRDGVLLYERATSSPSVN